ncbi:phosphopantetheine-binding protein [Omnitrophica bacterium]|nr:phosphopantetheine-binding protein [Candidatus Omnitrophota bacterium]
MQVDKAIYEKIKEALSTTFRIDTALICEDSHIRDDLGLDSIELMDAICVFENNFKIKILEKDAENIQIPNTVADLVILIQKKIKASSALG